MNLRNKKGFSLIEVMVALAIISVGTLGIMNIMEQFNKGQRFIEDRFDESDIIGEIKSLLADSASCLESLHSFNAMNTPEGVILSMKQSMSPNPSLPKLLAKSDATGPGYGLKHKKILGYSLQSSIITSPPAPDAIGFYASSHKGTSLLRVRFDRMGRPPITVSLPLNVTTYSTSDRRIAACSTLNTALRITAEDVCNSMRGFSWIADKCQMKSQICENGWHGSYDTGKWQSVKEDARCPANCTVQRMRFDQRHHTSGDFTSNSLSVMCCCPDLT